jgi:DNA-binding NtrC family response regulator
LYNQNERSGNEDASTDAAVARLRDPMVGDGDTPSRDSTMSFLTVPRPLAARHRLVVCVDGAEQVAVLPEIGKAVVGRARKADIRVPSTTVSRLHAQITVGAGAVGIVDLNSHNGTRVNGERLTSNRLLGYGDVITLGDVTVLFEEDTAAEQASSPRPSAADGQRVLDLDGIAVIVEDPAMRDTYVQLERLAASDLTVLVLGETGSGKELAARALRLWSKRRNRPLVSINCAALPEGVAESELFGHERGAFSGASGAKPGLFESAPGGTVFLDEIGDLSLAVQAKLLRVLENRCITRLGSVRERPIDVRVVSATHRNLVADSKVGRFRLDLYHRLSGAIVQIPPLRARQKELPVLARKFLDDARRALGKDPLALSDAAMERLRAHSWPGNVRELKNLMEYASAIVEHGTVELEHLAPRLAEEGVAPSSNASRAAAHATQSSSLHGSQPLDEAVRVFERRKIEAALAATGGNKTKAAKMVGVPLRTFMDKVKRHGLG